MRFEYINPFVDALINIVQEVLSADPRRGELYIKPSSSPLLGVVAYVGLWGDLEGCVLFDMAEETALAVSSAMNMEQQVQLNQEVKVTIKELAALITDRAVTMLQRLGIRVRALSPSIFSGSAMQFVHPDAEVFIVPIDMTQGTIAVKLAVREKA